MQFMRFELKIDGINKPTACNLYPLNVLPWHFSFI